MCRLTLQMFSPHPHHSPCLLFSCLCSFCHASIRSQNFVRKVEEQAKDLEFDVPYRELGFHGVPPHNKATSFIMPAVNALVELTEPPWFVCPLNDIEVAHFERVVMGLKNFDMVLVLKDFTQKPVQVHAGYGRGGRAGMGGGVDC